MIPQHSVQMGKIFPPKDLEKYWRTKYACANFFFFFFKNSTPQINTNRYFIVFLYFNYHNLRILTRFPSNNHF